jgi:hypothetical protein
MEMAELEAEASLKECAMLQRILQHRQSASGGGGGGGGQDSLDSLLMRSPLPLSFQPTTTATTNNTPASASSTSLHQILYGIHQHYPEQLSLTDDPAVDDDDGGDEYPNDDDDDDSDGVFDLDM